MGTDIHLFVEYDKGSESPFSGKGDIFCLNSGEVFLQHDYRLFDALAGGRNYSLTNPKSRPPLISPRGLPPLVSPQIYYRFYHIVDDTTYPDLQFDQLSRWIIPLPLVPESVAKEWIEKGWSVLAPPENHQFARPKRQRISDPSWHSTSWLTLDEICLSLRHHDIVEGDLQPDMTACLAAMRSIEEIIGVGRTRIIFWFAN